MVERELHSRRLGVQMDSECSKRVLVMWDRSSVSCHYTNCDFSYSFKLIFYMLQVHCLATLACLSQQVFSNLQEFENSMPTSETGFKDRRVHVQQALMLSGDVESNPGMASGDIFSNSGMTKYSIGHYLLL